jgi:hypothetical protein
MTDQNLDYFSENEVKYDEMLLNILQNEGKIESFMNVIFKFLYKRTDFFLIQESPKGTYGFPQNEAKNMIARTFQKYDSIPKEVLKKNFETKEKIVKNPPPPPPLQLAKESKLNIAPSAVTSSPKTQEIFQNNPSSYNGAERDNYSWTQTIKDIDIKIPVKPEIKSSKDVKIKIDKQQLQVSTKSSGDYLINDQLAWRIRPDDSTWSLFPGDHIQIFVEKQDERWWENLLVSEEKLDLKKINPEKPMQDLDEEAQAKIKQMMFDDRQKKLGLPTSEEQKNIDVLRRAWNDPNSPFKGQEFDPTILQNNKNF